nr:hypothetical protein [Tanacetum cinerariifolium]
SMDGLDAMLDNGPWFISFSEDGLSAITTKMEKISSLEDTTVSESFPPLTTPVTTTAGNAPVMSSYANISGKPSGKKVAYLVVANYVRNTWSKYRLRIVSIVVVPYGGRRDSLLVFNIIF